MTSHSSTFQKILYGLLATGIIVLVYPLSNAIYAYLQAEHAAALHVFFAGSGISITLLVLFIAWVQEKLRPNRRPWLAALLPIGSWLGFGMGLIIFGLSYWWGPAWKTAAAICLVAGQLLEWAWNWHEKRLNRPA